MKTTKIISILIIAALFCAGCAISPKKWDKCTKASCWNGKNAEQRMMNMLSPHMPDVIFNNYIKTVDFTADFIKEKFYNEIKEAGE